MSQVFFDSSTGRMADMAQRAGACTFVARWDRLLVPLATYPATERIDESAF
jgi:hypothetical protein